MTFKIAFLSLNEERRLLGDNQRQGTEKYSS